MTASEKGWRRVGPTRKPSRGAPGRRSSFLASLGALRVAGGVLVLAAGCSSPGTESATGVETPTTGPNATLRKIDHPVLENLLAVSGRMYSGGEPHGDEAFAALARLGIKTVVSVDGQKPDIAAARAQGLRYVHIPIGYDGVDDDAGRTLARLVRDADGPFCWRRSGCAADCRYRRASR